ncbi:Hypothetical predicted protein [Mytilus galloprovincialis]|uniref:Uncharacterized protein n=1 Tax=Mytilus galloprovincialis TaxID=29158 RepID=A0A8B6DJD1_MYTGA|nr:Hypothetical predicted protein [Mytilus galloprovincialis]
MCTESVKAICNLQHVQPYLQCLSMSTTTADEPSLPPKSMVNIKTAQKNDKIMKEWLYWVQEHRKPAKHQIERTPWNIWFINNFDKLYTRRWHTVQRNQHRPRANINCKKEPATKYVDAMKQRLKKAYELATRSARTAQERQKSGYDKKVRGAILQPGDRVLRENGEGKKKHYTRNLLLPIGFLPSDEEKRKDPAPVARRKVRQPTRKEPTKSESIEQIDETESDEESEQDYYVIVSEMSPQSNSDNDATSVEVDQTTGTLNATGDGHISVERGQGSGFGGDALPLAETNAGEPTPVVDDGNGTATGHEDEDDTSDMVDGSALTDTSLGPADVPTEAQTEQPTPTPPPQRQRQRRILPTPPRHSPDSPVTRPQRERKPPAYLKDYVTTSKQATTQPDWLRRVNWLLHQAENGRFKGQETELSRTIMKIMESDL